MQQAAPLTAVMFHNLADEVGAMGGANLPSGPLSNVLSQYLLRALRDAGYDQVTVQLVHGHEQAIEQWAEVFQAV